MKFNKLFLRAFILILLAVFSAIGWYLYALQSVSQSSSEQVVFVVPKGQSTKVILGRLEEQHLIRSAAAFDFYLYFSGQRENFQAGSFRLSPAMMPAQIIEALKHGTLDVWITIPEGWRAEQIVDKLQEAHLLSDIPKKDLYKIFRPHEGKLFPDTYLFANDSTPEQITSRMVETFSKKTFNFQFSTFNLILASLVEREAKLDRDRPLVASVLTNRLNVGMPLQVDATLQYAKASKACATCGTCDTCATLSGDWWPDIFTEDKKIASPYNTYLHPGLPPAPIANPGIPSINAAISPAKTNYLYYVSEPDGTTHYAKTLQEHNANVERYLR